MQRVHWDPEFARRSGNPTTYDYGRMRETWLIHLCTDWMGDDAWLWKLECEFRKFNYVGDTQWLRGHGRRASTSPTATGPRSTLDLEARTSAARSTTPGHATILLPSREHGPVRLPDPPGGARDLAGRADAISAEFSPPMTRTRVLRRPRVATGRAVCCGCTLDRPDKRNAIDDTMMRRPASTRVDAAGTDDARARDPARRRGRALLRRRRHRRPQRRQRDARPRAGSIQRRLPTQAHRLIPLICDVQVPVVCAVQGWAAGIGFQLALAADFTDRGRRRAVLGAVRRTRLHARQRRDVVVAAPRRRSCAHASCCCSGASSRGAEAAEWGAIHRAVPRRPTSTPRSTSS